VTVVPQVAARVAISPRLAVISTGASVPLKAAAYTAGGDSVFLPQVSWSAVDAGVSIGADGVATASAAGTYRVAAAVDAARDTATVAALGPSSLLVTALPQGQPLADVGAGSAFDVPVAVDLSRVSATGDLGSLQLDVTFDANVLAYDGFTAAAHGAVDANSSRAGLVRVAFAETSPQGTGAFTLVVLHFHVRAGMAGSRAAFGVAASALPTSTSFAPYSLPPGVGGTVRAIP
jgi:hypothetical protein